MNIKSNHCGDNTFRYIKNQLVLGLTIIKSKDALPRLSIPTHSVCQRRSEKEKKGSKMKKRV